MPESGSPYAPTRPLGSDVNCEASSRHPHWPTRPCARATEPSGWSFVQICQMGDVLRRQYRHDAVMTHTEMNLADSVVSQIVESELPTGTVTFLLTDIEGSTKLWEAGADETAISVARHYELLEAAVALHGGVRPVEQGEGDSVVGAF